MFEEEQMIIDLPQKYENMKNEITHDLHQQMYNMFKFQFLSVPKNFIKDTTNQNNFDYKSYILSYFNDYKFITYHYGQLGNSSEIYDVVVCVEGKCIIIENAELINFDEIIQKLEDQKKAVINKHCNILNENEIKNLRFKQLPKNNFFNITFLPIVLYLVGRYFYPTEYFENPNFFFFEGQNNYNFNEYEIKKYLKEIFDSKSMKNVIKNISMIHKGILRDQVQNEPNYFSKKDFIDIKRIYSNVNISFNLVFHRPSMHVFVMKTINNGKEANHEKDFCCQMNNHPSFTKFYGFVKDEKKETDVLLYEFMPNYDLNEFVKNRPDKLNDHFILIVMSRLIQGIEHLHSNSYIHCDLKPQNILVNNAFVPYITDFETIFKVNSQNPLIGDFGSNNYAPKEQLESCNYSPPVDIFSFGKIFDFLINKKNGKDDLSLCKCEELLKLRNSCLIEENPNERPDYKKVKAIIIDEFNSSKYFEQFFNNEFDKLDFTLISQFLYEMISIQDHNEQVIAKFIKLILFCQILSAFKKNHDDSNYYYYMGLSFYSDNIFKIDYVKAKKYFEKSGELNNSYALKRLGDLYFYGYGVQKDYSEAKKYYEKSSELKNSDSMHMLGDLYFYGYEVQKDYSKAEKYYKKSSELNNVLGTEKLGDFYFHQDNPDFVKARECYEKIDDGKRVSVLIKLCGIYFKGLGVKRDYSKAYDYIVKAVEQNDPEAQFILAYMYENGQGVRKDIKEAWHYLELSSNQKYAPAMINLAEYYYLHIDGRKADVDNYKKAVNYLKNVELEKSFASYYLGKMYFKKFTFLKDYSKAIEWLEMAAKLNNSFAKFYLGIMYLKGRGYEEDHKKAFEMIKEASSMGNSKALIYLGNLYLKGIGVKKNFDKAIKSFQEAGNLENSSALLILGKIYKDFFNNEKMSVQYFNRSSIYENPGAYFYLAEYYYFKSNVKMSISNYLSCISKKRYIKESPCPNENFIDRENKNNKYYYPACNNLGLIYLLEMNDLEKGEGYIKEAALGQYPYAQNNYGLLNQFFLKNITNAKDFYTRSSNDNFAMAEYNLGYLMEKEGEYSESINHYIKASEYEDRQLIFKKIDINDKLLSISIIIIMCLNNFKLVKHCLTTNKIDKARKYFIKSLAKFEIEDKINSYHLSFHFNNESKNNLFTYLKNFIFNFPLFNFNICSQSFEQSQSKSFNQKSEQQKSKLTDEKIIINYKSIKKELLAHLDDVKNNNIIFKLKEKEKISINNKNEDQNAGEGEKILGKSDELFDSIMNDNDLKSIFLDEINDIIITMENILYTPPYNILFGRIYFPKPTFGDSINQLFNEGLDIPNIQ